MNIKNDGDQGEKVLLLWGTSAHMNDLLVAAQVRYAIVKNKTVLG